MSGLGGHAALGTRQASRIPGEGAEPRGQTSFISADIVTINMIDHGMADDQFLEQALLHCRGIGPARLRRLHHCGLLSWSAIISQPEKIPFHLQLIDNLLAEVERCQQAKGRQDIRYFTQQFCPQDHWRILAHYRDRVAYFDLETTGLGFPDYVTVIVCYHRDRLHYFVEKEDLDDFLALLDDIDLLVSFNGTVFDVPRILATFHLFELPCAHIDLRWVSYHAGYTGGLKSICSMTGLNRPDDLDSLTGMDAVYLWERWLHHHDRPARNLLIRYCCADVLLLVQLTHYLLGYHGLKLPSPLPPDPWGLLPFESP